MTSNHIDPSSPVSLPPDGGVDLETVQTLLDLLNPLHGSLDEQTYDEKLRENFDAPRDYEHHVMVTSGQEGDLTQAVRILEDRKAALSAPVGEPVLPCDVRLPPATTIRKGCKVSTLMFAIKQRETYDESSLLFLPAPAVGEPGAYARGFDDGQISMERTITDLKEQIAELEAQPPAPAVCNCSDVCEDKPNCKYEVAAFRGRTGWKDGKPPVGTSQNLADKLERLCCAETEGKFFDCVTDNIQTILSALRRPS